VDHAPCPTVQGLQDLSLVIFWAGKGTENAQGTTLISGPLWNEGKV
jgi:hypothetical protein